MRTAIVLNHPKVTLATTQAGLTTGQAVECQLTSAVLTPQPVYNTIPATGCAGASQSPGLTGWSLELAWLEDWNKTAATSMSNFAFVNDGLPVWYKLELDSVGMAGGFATGSAYAASGAYGGTFGDGSAAATTSSWPCVDKPTITPPTTPITTATVADADADADADAGELASV